MEVNRDKNPNGFIGDRRSQFSSQGSCQALQGLPFKELSISPIKELEINECFLQLHKKIHELERNLGEARSEILDLREKFEVGRSRIGELNKEQKKIETGLGVSYAFANQTVDRVVKLELKSQCLGRRVDQLERNVQHVGARLNVIETWLSPLHQQPTLLVVVPPANLPPY